MKKAFTNIFALLLVAILSFSIQSCGGGGGGDDNAPSTYSISGIVTSLGVGLQGVTMTLNASATVTTDANGNYSFSNLSDGNYTVTPSKTGYTFSPSSLFVTLNGANVSGQNFTGVALGQSPFKATVGQYSETVDINQKCIDEYGSGYRLADWNDVVAYYSSGQSMQQFFSDATMNATGEAASNRMVSRDGQRFDGTRQYFVTRFDHSLPSYYASYANIDNHLVDLGSGDGHNMPVLCYASIGSPIECPNIAGTWNGTVHATDADPVGITLSLSQNGCNVTGTEVSDSYFPCDIPPIAVTGTVSGNIFSATMGESPVIECELICDDGGCHEICDCEPICYTPAQSGNLTINGDTMDGHGTTQDCDDPTLYDVTIHLSRSSASSSLNTLNTIKGKTNIGKSCSLFRKR